MVHKQKVKNDEKYLSLAELKKKFADWIQEDIDMSDEIDDGVIYEVKFVEKVNKTKTIDEFYKPGGLGYQSSLDHFESIIS